MSNDTGMNPNTNPPAGVDPNSPMITGAVPTQATPTTGTIPPATAPAPGAPSAPGTTPAVFAQQPAPGSPQSSTAPPNAQQDDPSGHLSIFRRVLAGLARPSTQYVDANGNVARGGPSISSSILAGAVAGMLSKPSYREGAFGPVYDSQGTAANAFQAGQKQVTDQQEQVQKMSDDQMAKKMMVAKNNIDMIHAYAAMTMQQHQEIGQTADRNQSTILADLDKYDDGISDPAQKIHLGKGLAYADALAMAQAKGLTSTNMLIDGYRDQYDPDTKQTTVVPLFSVINPNAKIQMSESAARRSSGRRWCRPRPRGSGGPPSPARR